MDKQLYNVVFRGEILEGRDPEEVKAKLAVLFKATPEKVDQLFSGKPIVIAHKLDGPQAQRYRDAFEKAGARCEVGPVAGNVPAKAGGHDSAEGRGSAAPAARKPACPKCGAELAGGPECSACGIIIEKYLARQAQERNETGIPVGETVPVPETLAVGGGSNRRRALYVLVPVLILVAGFVFWMLRPDNPPKDRLLALANKMIANMEAYGKVIEETDDFRKSSDFIRSGQAKAEEQFVAGMTLPQFEQVVKLSNEEYDGTISVRNIGAALRSANVPEEIRKSNESIRAEMEKLNDAAEGCDEEFKPIISELQALYKTYTRFTDLALAPENKGNLAKYCGDYILQKSLTASFFDGWVKRLSRLKEPPESRERWDAEYETALAGIRKLQE